MFWASLLSGRRGYLRGDGIWQVNTRKPYGLLRTVAPGWASWDVAAQLPGSRQLGLAKQFLTRFEWWRMEPHPEWVEPHWSKQDYRFVCGRPGQPRIVFVHQRGSLTLKRLAPGLRYQASFSIREPGRNIRSVRSRRIQRAVGPRRLRRHLSSG